MRRRIDQYVFGLSCIGEVWLIGLLAQHGDFLRPGGAWKFTAWGMAAGVAYWLAASSFERGDFPTRQSAWVFWVGAVALRLMVFTVEPGDDLWRYRWEGMVQLHGFSPYAFSPDAPALSYLRDADWAKINHRDYPAIYPPLAQTFFALMALCGNSVWLYKLVFALADLACCWVLRRLLLRNGTDGARAAWYAWNPLAVYAFTGAAHFDCLMILALLGAIWALDVFRPDHSSDNRAKDDERNISFLWLSAFLLGVAAAIKIVPLALFPIWVVAVGSWRRVMVLVVLVTGPLAASATAYGFPRTPVFAALQRFGREFRVNDPLWWAVDLLTGSRLPIDNRVLEGCTILACLLLAYRFRRNWRRGLLWVWGALLLLSPVVHAWYVVWVLPVAVWWGPPARPWVILSLSTFGYFLLWEINHESGRPWTEPLWLRLLIYLPPVLALGWTSYAQRHHRLDAA